mmetsp:Transcript_21016/g.34677  ORF Transcript_21016/g.34677 Transcript_21016/m.34677 type:complete len:90 (-) Transcript_21016:636-905(-)
MASWLNRFGADILEMPRQKRKPKAILQNIEEEQTSRRVQKDNNHNAKELSSSRHVFAKEIPASDPALWNASRSRSGRYSVFFSFAPLPP